ncbi:MAG: serine hydrolase domain-containing protein [Gemmatimonadota bacterium]
MLLHCILATAFIVAPQQSPGGDRSARVDSLVEQIRVQREIPGIAVAVVRDGRVIKAAGYGFANLELRAPVTPRTRFGLGSISKQFTATAIMMLVEGGRVRLDDPITRYVDSLPPHWGRITVRHLLTHTSGLPEEHWLPSFVEFDRFEHGQLDVLRTIFSDSLQSAPGAKWAYRNSAFRLLGMIIERASGESYWSFLDRRIFRPLGMTATRSSDPKTLIPDRAQGYGKEAGRIVNRDAVTESAAFSEGALMSSVLDLAKWDSALYSPTIISQASLDQMWTPVRLNDGSSYPYGFGWALAPTNGLRTVSHGGSLPGFVTMIGRYVAKRLTVIILTNAEWSNPDSVARAVAGVYEADLQDSK